MYVILGLFCDIAHDLQNCSMQLRGEVQFLPQMQQKLFDGQALP